MDRRAALFVAAAVVAAAGSRSLTPRHRAAKHLPEVALASQVPLAIEGWRVDTSIIPLQPDPVVQAELDKIYGQVLARTYVSPQDHRVMLSIAYGEDQGTDATAAHRPEFCYAAQGFSVRSLGTAQLQFGDHVVTARRLLGQLDRRIEPITYWVTLNESAVLPGIRRKMEQIRLGLLGQIPDGMLIRTSTVGLPVELSFKIQDQFLAAMREALSPDLRTRYFGG